MKAKIAEDKHMHGDQDKAEGMNVAADAASSPGTLRGPSNQSLVTTPPASTVHGRHFPSHLVKLELLREDCGRRKYEQEKIYAFRFYLLDIGGKQGMKGKRREGGRDKRGDGKSTRK